MRHKHADMIIKWAETGRKLQYIDSYGEWHDVLGTPGWHAGTKYRFKPEVLRYRTALIMSGSGSYGTCSVNSEFGVRQVESLSSFVKWIDTEWKEVEV